MSHTVSKGHTVDNGQVESRLAMIQEASDTAITDMSHVTPNERTVESKKNDDFNADFNLKYELRYVLRTMAILGLYSTPKDMAKVRIPRQDILPRAPGLLPNYNGFVHLFCGQICGRNSVR